MKKVIVMLAAVLAIGAASAQENMITIKGTVTDKKTKEMLPGVTVYVQDGYHYTQTNGDGVYIIKVPEKYRDGNLIFSLFGYDRDTVAVKAAVKRPDIKLKTGGAIKLSEVVVSEYTPKSLINEAVKRIPQNYWTDSTIGTFFYRDCRQLKGELYLFDEMVFDALRVGYDKHNTIHKTKANVKGTKRAIESNYKTILFSRLLVNDTDYVNRFTNGTGGSYLNYSDNEALFDPLEIPNTTNYLAKRKQKMWEYTMQTFADQDSVDHYCVTQLRKDNHAYGFTYDTARITVTKGSLAITKVELNFYTRINSFPWPMSLLVSKTGIDSLEIREHSTYNYGEIDGKMTLTSFSKHREIVYFCTNGSKMGAGETHIVLDCQGILTSQRKGDASFLDSNAVLSPVRIAVSDRQSGELRYDEEFWNQYNFVPLEEATLRKLNARLEKK